MDGWVGGEGSGHSGHDDVSRTHARDVCSTVSHTELKVAMDGWVGG